MKIVEIGDIGARYNDWMPDDERLPENGIIIEATKDELKELGALLYQEVKVVGQ